MSGNGKVALVTVASRGISKEIAKRLACDGFSVVVNFVSNGEAAREVADEISSGGGDAVVIQADVSGAASVAMLFDRSIQIPVILLTALKEDVDRIIGLEIGLRHLSGRLVLAATLTVTLLSAAARADTFAAGDEGRCPSFWE